MSVMQYLLWFMQWDHQEFEEGASNEWKKTCVVIDKVAERTREIVIHAYKCSECPTTDMPSVDVGRVFLFKRHSKYGESADNHRGRLVCSRLHDHSV